ncbi:unnamed protein product [Prunus armeniaca]|uniref:Uncharacterized protein n=1 Tax=Prunus armeniaca TaxID=36596 RepID=A0A6J5VQ68_PRUAR|nr:unnamed protein product [Prunus armeniaca]
MSGLGSVELSFDRGQGLEASTRRASLGEKSRLGPFKLRQGGLWALSSYDPGPAECDAKGAEGKNQLEASIYFCMGLSPWPFGMAPIRASKPACGAEPQDLVFGPT